MAVESRFADSQTKHKAAVGIPIIAPVAVSKTATSVDMLEVSGETLRDASIYRRFSSAMLRELGLGKCGKSGRVRTEQFSI